MSLGQTLSLLMVIALLALCLAASTISQLQLSSRFAQRAQADAMARAAINEFILREHQTAPPPDITSPPPPFLSRFAGQERLLSPGGRVACTATILTRDCVDNLQGSQVVQGRFDNSVPPYTLSLVFEVDDGRHRYVYEALLQQRWPYAVTGVGPIIVCGQVDPSTTVDGRPDMPLPPKLWSQLSRVEGRILGLTRSTYQAPRNRWESRVSESAMQRLMSFATGGHLPPVVTDSSNPENVQFYRNPYIVSLGGKIYLYDFRGFSVTTGTGPNGTSEITPNFERFQQMTNGAQVTGDIDILSPDSDLTADRAVSTVGGTHTGVVRINPAHIPSEPMLQKILAQPDTSNWETVGGIPEVPGSALAFRGPGSTGSGILVASGRGRIPHTVRFPETNARNPDRTDLSLENVAMYVQGDLEINGRLYGSSSTLVVGGTLSLDDATLDSGGNGLVVYCQRLIARAQGELHGLVVAQQGASIYSYQAAGSEATLPPRFKIDGGIVVGGNDLKVGSYISEANVEVTVECLTLVGTEVRYNPRYMRNLNHCGPFSLRSCQLRR